MSETVGPGVVGPGFSLVRERGLDRREFLQQLGATARPRKLPPREELEETYKRAEVEARRSPAATDYTLSTKNVTRLRLDTAGPDRLIIDGQALTAGANPTLEKNNGRWMPANRPPVGRRKVHGLQGPVDDAFMDPFLCVRPTGTPWNPVTQEWATKTFQTFAWNFAKWLRGDVRSVTW